MKERTLINILIAATLGLTLLIGLHSQRLERENSRLHAAVNASTVPPSTNNVSTR